MSTYFLKAIIDISKIVHDELEIYKKNKIKEKMFINVGGVTISLELYHILRDIMNNEIEKLEYIADIKNDAIMRIKYLLHIFINHGCELIEREQKI